MTKQYTEELPIHEGSIHSSDGTRIGFHYFGSGPSLVFVHGSMATHTDWLPAARLLAAHHTCILVDRRGRGRSSFGPAEYSMETECADIAAVITKATDFAALVGHSYGATCCIEAATRLKLPRVALYEPVLSLAAPIAGEYLDPYCQAIAQDDMDEAVQIGMEHFIRYATEEIAGLRATRAWKRLQTLAPTWGRELRVMDTLSTNLERYRSVACPVLLFRGSESPEHPMQRTVRDLASTLPDSRVVTCDGHNHMGLRTAAEQVAREIQSFLMA